MGASPSSLSSNVETFVEINGAPCFECVIGDRGNSEFGGSTFSDDAPPSFTDIVRRDASESSFEHNLHEVKFEEASLSKMNPKVRLVRCPRCKNVLPEPQGVFVYKCGGCGAYLVGKNCSEDQVIDSSSNQQSPDNSIHAGRNLENR